VVGALSALVPPRSSVLPPGAGNEEPDKALKAGKEGAKKVERRSTKEAGLIEGHRHASTVARDDDGDGATVAALKVTQCGLR
jgi:hypothetical protein